MSKFVTSEIMEISVLNHKFSFIYATILVLKSGSQNDGKPFAAMNDN